MQRTPGFLLDLRLFLEGIEVPVVSASVTSTIGQSASAVIEVVPTDKLKLLLPRTVVHLFFLDSTEFLESGASEPLPEHYKSLFCGEVFSITFSKSGMGSRTASLSCRDFSTVWDTSFAYSLNYDADATASIGGDSATIQNNSAFLTTSQIVFDSIINSTSSIIAEMSRGNPGLPSLQGANDSSLGGLFNILEALSGTQGLFYGTSPWTTIQERRTRVLESIITDSGETAKTVYLTSQFSDWLRSRIATQGAAISFRQTLNTILDYVFYNVVTNVTPAYEAGSSEVVPNAPNRDVPKYLDSADDSLPADSASSDEALQELRAEFRDIASEFISKVRAKVAAAQLPSGDTTARVVITDALRERAEVVSLLSRRFNRAPSDDEILKYELNSAHVNGFALDIQMIYDSGRSARIGVPMPHRTNLAAKPVVQDVSDGQTWYLRLRRLVYSLAQAGTPASFVSQLETLGRLADNFAAVYSTDEQFTQDILTFKDFVVWAEIVKSVAAATPEVRSLAVPSETRDSDPLFILGNIGTDPVHFELRNWRQIVGAGVASTIPGSKPQRPIPAPAPASQAARERLKSFMFRPDVWFIPPPACNIIYPDHLQSFMTQRDMLRETSRLQLQIGLEFTNDAAVADKFYAPQLSAGPTLRDSSQQASTEGGTTDSILIYDHEKYSGVVPKFQAMDNVLFYKNVYAEGASPEDVLIPSYETYARKVAHFNLLSERYQAKSASASLAFNPFVVAGFPALILDSTATTEITGGSDLKDRAFTLGMVNSVTHSITQGGAITSIVLTHVRTHRTGSQAEDQFFELFQNDATMDIQEENKRTLRTESWSMTSPMTLLAASPPEGADLAFWRLFAATFLESDILAFVKDLPVSTDRTVLAPLDGFQIYEDIEPIISISEVPVLGGVIKRGKWTGSFITAVILYFLKNGEDVTEVGLLPVGSASLITGDLLEACADAGYPQMAFSAPDGQYFEVLVPVPKDSLIAEIVSPEEYTGTLPVEEAIRPQWISKDYSAMPDSEKNLSRLTNKIYAPFFGSVSITDLVPQSVSLDGYAFRTIEQSVDWLAANYAEYVSTNSLNDPLSYIDSLTRRPIATLPQVLGGKHLQLDTQGRVRNEIQSSDETWGPNAKYQGGFHSNAVNFGSEKYGQKLEYLDIKDVGLRHRMTATANPFTLEGAEGDRLDPRAERARRVMEYRDTVGGTSAVGRNHVSGIGKRG